MKSYRFSVRSSREKIKIIPTLRAGRADLAVQNKFKRKKTGRFFGSCRANNDAEQFPGWKLCFRGFGKSVAKHHGASRSAKGQLCMCNDPSTAQPMGWPELLLVWQTDRMYR